MDVVQQAVHHLNPGQVPVLTLDQPLYATAKQIQWNWPSGYGEDKFVILLGGLHLAVPAVFCKKKSQILHPKCKILQAEKANFAKILQCFYTA